VHGNVCAFGRVYAGSAGINGTLSLADFLVLSSSAKKGVKSAQFKLGLLFLENGPIRRDVLRAAHWLQQAAQQGDQIACHLLGLLFYTGYEDISTNKQNAAQWLAMASDIPEAQNLLGIMYSNGIGVPKSCATALELFHRAANAGCATALQNLSSLYAGHNLTVPATIALKSLKQEIIDEIMDGDIEVIPFKRCNCSLVHST
jgi:uncharacterized protein